MAGGSVAAADAGRVQALIRHGVYLQERYRPVAVLCLLGPLVLMLFRIAKGESVLGPLIFALSVGLPIALGHLLMLNNERKYRVTSDANGWGWPPDAAEEGDSFAGR